MDEKEATVDLDAVVTFYDPHPGFAGAAVPIPNAVKKVADELSDKTMTLREAVAKLKKVTNGEIIVEAGAIMLKIKPARGRHLWHVWRVIKYR